MQSTFKKCGLYIVTGIVLIIFVLLGNEYLKRERYYKNPHLRINESLFNIGSIFGGVDTHEIIPVYNAGGKPLVIKSVSVSCGCIKKHKMLKSVIMPETSENLELVLHASTYTSGINEIITLYSNDPEQPIRKVTLKAVIKSPIVFDPPSINLGIIKQSDLPITKKVTVNISQGFDSKTEPLQISNSSNSLVTTSTLDSNQKEINITIPSNAPIGPIDSNILIFNKSIAPQHYSVLGQILGSCHAKPEEIFVTLPNAEMNSKLSKKLDIVSNDKKIEKIKVMNILPELAKVLQVRITNTTINFNFNLSHNSSSQIKGSILLQVDFFDGTNSSLVIPVKIVIKPPSPN